MIDAVLGWVWSRGPGLDGSDFTSASRFGCIMSHGIQFPRSAL